MVERPIGTVTFLFTDIEGSTRLLRQLGAERYGAALEEHRRMVRAAIAEHGGHEVDTQGDAFLVAFGTASDAVQAAAQLQLALASVDWPEQASLRVRMGLHTTEASATGEGYVGLGVHRGARIAAAAHGGQILLSQATRELLADDEGGPGMLDLGVHRLKDLTAGEHLFQVVAPGLADGFPPPRSLESHHQTNLPVQPTSLIGRTTELAEVGRLLRRVDVRLVTMTGPGGTGKTRLALQAAAELIDDFPDGVLFVPLTPITDPQLVVPTIRQVVGVSESAGQDLTAYLATKKLLLVIDNFEQVIVAAPALAELLSTAHDLKLLVTSREPLRVAAERVYPVEPLALPDLRRLPDVAALSRFDALALFVERAQAAVPSFSLSNENAAAVAEICVRLDGLPLAIELAAARSPILTPHQMLTRLSVRLKLLTGGARDQPTRHQTLRDTLSWSYDLLAAEEQRLFAALGVFSGRFSLEAGEEVCAADVDGLASLIDKSLLRRDRERYFMLDTIREYAAQLLATGDERDALRERHAGFFETMAEEAYLERHARQAIRARQLEAEHDNLRAALDWLVVDPQRRLRLAGALGWFWHVHSHFSEGRARLSEALAAEPAEGTDRARALSSAGELAAWQGDLAPAERLLNVAVAMWRDLGREQEVALAFHELGWAYFFGGQDEAAREAMDASLLIQQSIGDPLLVNRAQLGVLQMLVALGDIETVKRLGPQALELSQRLGDVWYEHFAHHFLADCALIEADFDLAQQRYARSLDAAWRSGDEVETCYELQGVAMAASGLGHAKRATRLAGAAEAHLAALGVTQLPSFWGALLDRHIGAARRQLGTEADEALEEGKKLDFERAVEEALELPGGS